MASLNLGVIGLGRMGRIFARHIATHSRLHGDNNASLYAVSSRTPAVAEQVAELTGNTKIYPDYRDLLADPAVDGVLVATLTHTHYDIVLAAAEAGKAIFCEKPLSLKMSETEDMLAAIDKAKVPFQVAFMRRFDKGYAAAKQKIDAGVIGEPIVAMATSRDPGCPDQEWAKADNSGGMIIDLAVHDFDILRWLMNDEVTRVYAEGAALTCPDVGAVGDIDSALITLRFANGAMANVDACRNCRYGYDIRCEIRGTEGTLQVGYIQDTPVLTLNQQGVTHDVVPWFEQRFTPAYNAQIDHFIECLHQDVAPSVGAEDARRSLQIALAATQSQQEKQPIVLID